LKLSHATISDFARIPLKQREFIRTEFRSEADWVKAAAAGDLGKSYSSTDKYGNQVKMKTLAESGNTLYWGDVHPGFEVGKLKEESLRELIESEEKPKGLIAEGQMDVASFAKQYGDPNSAKAYSLDNLKTKWLFESLKTNLD